MIGGFYAFGFEPIHVASLLHTFTFFFFLRISIGIGLVYCWLGFYWMVSLGLLDSGI